MSMALSTYWCVNTHVITGKRHSGNLEVFHPNVDLVCRSPLQQNVIRNPLQFPRRPGQAKVKNHGCGVETDLTLRPQQKSLRVSAAGPNSALACILRGGEWGDSLWLKPVKAVPESRWLLSLRHPSTAKSLPNAKQDLMRSGLRYCWLQHRVL